MGGVAFECRWSTLTVCIAFAAFLYSVHLPPGAKRHGPCVHGAHQSTLLARFDALEPVPDVAWLKGQNRAVREAYELKLYELVRFPLLSKSLEVAKHALAS